MSDSSKLPPADALLLRERARRLRAAQPGDADDIVAESDALIDETPAASGARSAAIDLYRPLSLVSLARMSWSGGVDHEALQNAIVCSPVRAAGAPAAPGWLAAVSTLALAQPPRDSALHVSLGPDDAAVLEHAGLRFSSADALALVRAAALPVRVVGTDDVTAEPLGNVLRAYRRASLVHAWQTATSGGGAAESAAERDTAAARLVSALRSLL